ncbi:hypothetical protein D3C87_1398910 [compost metagenome]
MLHDHRRNHIGRRDCIGGDAERGKFASGRVSEAHQRRFRDRIGRARRQATGLPGIGRDVDQPPPAVFLHGGNDGLRQQQGGIEIDGHQPVPVIKRGRSQLVRRQHTGIVDENVYDLETVGDIFHDGLQRRRIAEIDGDGITSTAKPLRKRRNSFDVAIEGDYPRPLRDQRRNHGTADAATSACHERRLVFQFHSVSSTSTIKWTNASALLQATVRRSRKPYPDASPAPFPRRQHHPGRERQRRPDAPRSRRASVPVSPNNDGTATG